MSDTDGGSDPGSRRRPRIVHVTTADISLALLLGPQLRAFQAAGYEVIGASAPGPHVADLERWGIRHEPLAHATRSMAPQQDLKALFELRTLFRRLAPDLVHTHNPKPGLYGRVAAKLARVPAIVNTIHGLYALPEDPWAKRAVVYSLERAAATCSDAELLQNVEDVEVLRRLRVPARKIHVLGNGIDLTRFDPDRFDATAVADLRASIGVAPGEVVCGVVGRMVWEKGYREVFAAAAALRDRVPNLRFVVVGPMEAEKEDAITQADVDRVARDANITFLGMRDDVDRLYRAMDMYLLASYREGFPRSAMEAAAMGLPVVVTNVRGCRQVVEDGTTGLLVPVGDAGAIADAVAALATDASRRAAMGRAGRAKAAREFDDQRVIDITLGVYEALLGGPPAVAA